jgi:hypothetical protein
MGVGEGEGETEGRVSREIGGCDYTHTCKNYPKLSYI